MSNNISFNKSVPVFKGDICIGWCEFILGKFQFVPEKYNDLLCLEYEELTTIAQKLYELNHNV